MGAMGTSDCYFGRGQLDWGKLPCAELWQKGLPRLSLRFRRSFGLQLSEMATSRIPSPGLEPLRGKRGYDNENDIA